MKKLLLILVVILASSCNRYDCNGKFTVSEVRKADGGCWCEVVGNCGGFFKITRDEYWCPCNTEVGEEVKIKWNKEW